MKMPPIEEIRKVMNKLEPPEMVDFIEGCLEKAGKLTDRMRETLEKMKAEMAKMNEEWKGLSSDLKVLVFDMEFKEKTDKMFEELYKVAAEELGVVADK